MLFCLLGCYEEKIHELNTDFAKICITPKPPGAPKGKFPLPILKELEHQTRQNISTLNFTAAFAKTSSSSNATLEKCQHSLNSTFKTVKQHRALTCLSKSLAHILQRELYTMGNTGLLRGEAKMTLLQPQLGERDAKNSLFKSQLVKEGEDFLL